MGSGETEAMAAPYSYRDDPAVPPFPDDRPIIVFDGYCGFCSGFARFVMRHDRAGRYRLLAAQTDLGRALYRHYGLDPDNYATNILLENGVARFKSDGSIAMFSGLGFPWSLAGAARILPRRVRDAGYAVIARNRLRIAGRRATCFVPSEQDRARFLG